MKTIKTSLILLAFTSLFTFSGCKKEDSSSTTETPVTPTEIEFNVIDEIGNAVSGVAVSLYTNKTDADNKTNAIRTAYSDGAGAVKFSNVSPIVYYFYGVKECKNNTHGAMVISEALKPNVKSTFNLVVKPTGTIALGNASSNPYHIYINGVLVFDLDGTKTLTLDNVPTGSYTIRVLQISGYVLFPTDKTYSVNVSCGNQSNILFP